ncbi:MAG: ankyrin repeat domain-containing protein [Phycisphaeraceae bacterium]|nr:MAG: ankyrin repeat domain-containing protein [Phycisphaeraceae bacterium]
MPTHARSPLPLIVLVLCLLGAAGGLYVWATQQSRIADGELPSRPRPAPTALHEAATRGDAPAIAQALSSGALPDATIDGATRSHRGLTPLMLAAMHGHADAARALLKGGAKVDLANEGGWTPLMFASAYGGHEAVRVLLDAGATVNARTLDAQATALMLAANAGEPASVRALLAKGADTSFRNKWGESALHLAARARSPEAVRAILGTSPDVNLKDQKGNTPLVGACEGDDAAETVRALLDAKADPNLPNDQGLTPLACAAFTGDEATVRLLLERGAARDARDSDGRSPADWALSRDDDKGKALAALITGA